MSNQEVDPLCLPGSPAFPNHSGSCEPAASRPARAPAGHKPRRIHHRPLRCDCGQPAITEIEVRVGSDPQYTICLPLCPACLQLERELHHER